MTISGTLWALSDMGIGCFVWTVIEECFFELVDSGDGTTGVHRVCFPLVTSLGDTRTNCQTWYYY